MKAVILAGGLGSRISEETKDKPKPMVEIGGKPILWHIMKIYSHYGINDFVICCGYKGEIIRDYFLENKEAWNVSCVDTGLETMTGGRLKRVQKFIDDTFCFTYGDTVNNLNIEKLIKFHKNEGRLATVTACIPPEKYGVLEIKEGKVVNFEEKPPMKEIWVNGGFFVLEPNVFDYIEKDSTVWEKEPLQNLVRDNELTAFKHEGFYQHMDTLKEKNFLNDLWKKNQAKWKIWK